MTGRRLIETVELVPLTVVRANKWFQPTQPHDRKTSRSSRGVVRCAAAMADTSRSILSSMPNAESEVLSNATIQRINSRMDVISRHCAATAIGQTLELAWFYS